MRLIIESTGSTAIIGGLSYQLWRGTTPGNNPVDVYVHMVGSENAAAQLELAMEFGAPIGPLDIDIFTPDTAAPRGPEKG